VYSRIAKNAKLGDGHISRNCKNANLSFMSTDLDVLKLKRRMCEDEGFICRDFGTQKSGYGGTKTIYNFHTRVHEKITQVYEASYSDLIKTLDKQDLFLWLVDDGSWHKNQNLFHLYCNMLNDDEANLLIEQIYKLYGVRPRLRKDRKKDGREFNYLYFPRRLTILVRPEFKKFLIENNLHSMLYKVGGEDYEDPLEKLSPELITSSIYPILVKKYASIRHYDKSPIINEYPEFVSIKWRSPNGEEREKVIYKEEIA
jgi:LAGLIDADG DNA endonuclease family